MTGIVVYQNSVSVAGPDVDPLANPCVPASMSNGSPRHSTPGRSNSAIDATAARRASVRQQYSQRGRMSSMGKISLVLPVENLLTLFVFVFAH